MCFIIIVCMFVCCLYVASYLPNVANAVIMSRAKMYLKLPQLTVVSFFVILILHFGPNLSAANTATLSKCLFMVHLCTQQALTIGSIAVFKYQCYLNMQSLGVDKTEHCLLMMGVLHIVPYFVAILLQNSKDMRIYKILLFIYMYFTVGIYKYTYDHLKRD